MCVCVCVCVCVERERERELLQRGTKNSTRMLKRYFNIVPVEIKMVALCKSDNEINPRVSKVHMDVRIYGRVLKRNFNKRQFTTAED